MLVSFDMDFFMRMGFWCRTIIVGANRIDIWKSHVIVFRHSNDFDFFELSVQCSSVLLSCYLHSTSRISTRGRNIGIFDLLYSISLKIVLNYLGTRLSEHFLEIRFASNQFLILINLGSKGHSFTKTFIV